MAQSLPENLDLLKAVSQKKFFSGDLCFSDFSRLPESVIENTEKVAYSISFLPLQGLSGQALIDIRAELEMICQRTLRRFCQYIEIDSRIGFIRSLEEEKRLLEGMSPSFFNDGFVKPKELIEDELLLNIPEVPILAGSVQSEMINKYENVDQEDDPESPFSILEKLKS